MKWIDEYKNEYQDEELLEIEDDDVYEVTLDELLQESPKIREKLAKERVMLFVALDEALKEQGYDDKDERLRIIELIF